MEDWCSEPKPRSRVSCLLIGNAIEKLTISIAIKTATEKIAFFLLFYVLLSDGRAFAQLTPDTTLGGESSVVTPSVLINNQIGDRIDGGASRGANLFHSFLEFNLNTGQQVYFASPSGIENIITRVTGNNSSNILGTLGVDGSANLFLINPNGILFGPNARLALRGSFFASTASSVVLADGNQFSAITPQNPSLLTVSVPLGLQFGANPKPLTVQGSNLVVPLGKTLGLVGGGVTLQGGTVAAPSGRVELGSVAGNGLVNLNPTTNGWELGYSGVQNFQNIQLSQGATVDVSGSRGGDIQVQARTFQLGGESRLTALTLGEQSGGNVTINASDSVELTGTGTYIEDTIKFATGTITPTNLRNGLFTASFGSGAAGDIEINTPSFIANNGAFVATSTFGSGKGGNLTLNASKSVNLSASSLLTGSGAGNGGDAGSLTINTGRLVAQDNATVTTTSLGAGGAGNLTVNASDSVELIGGNPVQIPPAVRFFTGLFSSTLATGDAGDVQVRTGRLLVRDGAAIAASTTGQGQGGDITVTATDAVELRGSSPNGQALSALAATAETGSTGKGGNLTVQTRNLILQDTGRLSVRSRGTGDAGNLEVVADSIRLDNQGSIAAATTAAGEGGNIKLKTQSLQLRRNSIINAEADGSGNGGNISIDTGTLVALEYSNITANAFQGTGGSIKINTQGLFVDPTSKISASSTLGINGVVDINTTVNYVQTFLPTLEENFVSPDRIVAVSCLAQRNFKRGSFTVIGSGGLPSSPYSAFTAVYGLTDVERLSGNSEAGERDYRLNESNTGNLGHSVSTGAMPSELTTIPQGTRSSSTPPLQEAQGMFVTADGVVILVTAPQLEALAKADDLICHPESSVSQSTQ